MTESRNDERQTDPRGLSDEKPGRSKIQEDIPPLPTRDAVQKRDKDDVKTVTEPPPSEADLERRDARAHSAMPYGTRGSRKGKLAGGEDTPEDRKHES